MEFYSLSVDLRFQYSGEWSRGVTLKRGISRCDFQKKGVPEDAPGFSFLPYWQNDFIVNKNVQKYTLIRLKQQLKLNMYRNHQNKLISKITFK